MNIKRLKHCDWGGGDAGGGDMWEDDKGEYVLYADAVNLLEQAAEEFDRRAMSPAISAGFECTRVMACATWLRDMADELKGKA